jgi:hypothetical protein
MARCSRISSWFQLSAWQSDRPSLDSANVPLISTTLDITTTAVDEPGTLSLGGVGLVSILGLMLLRHRGIRIG